MNTPAAHDDYLLDLLGDAAAPAATPSTPHVVAVATVDAGVRQNDTTAAAPPLVDATPSVPVLAVAPIRAGSEADLISDDEATFADTSALRDWIGFQPATPLKDGVARFVDWYRGYYGH